MKIHDGSRLKGVRYPCPKCEHAATTVRDLNRHVRNKHEEVVSCSECKFTLTTASYLNKHVENKHTCVRYLEHA